MVAEPTNNEEPQTIEVDAIEIAAESDPGPAPEAGQSTRSPEPKSGVLSAVLAALLFAAVVGFAVYYVMNSGVRTEDQAQIDSLTNQIKDLANALEERAVPVEVESNDELQELVSQQLGGLNETISALNNQLATVDQRMEALESSQAPAATEEVGQALDGLRTDLSSWQTAAEKLRAENEDLRATIEEQKRALDEARTFLAEAEMALAEALELKDLNDSERREGLIARIEAAVSAGRPFKNELTALQALGDAKIPSELYALAESGVPASAQLRDRFPELARQALSADLAAQEGNGALEQGLNFMKAQLGLRSVTAREGDSVDSVLSRMQAAVVNGDISKALTESSGLSDVAQAEMQNWLSAAHAHVAADNFLLDLKDQAK